MSSTDDPVTDQLERHEKKSWLGFFLRPKVAIPLILLISVLLSPFIIRGYYLSLSGVPDPPEPFDREPLESYVVADDENAYSHYRLAAALFTEPVGDVSEAREAVNAHGWTLATPELEQFLHDSEDALIEWKAGSQLEKSQNIRPEDYDFAVALPAMQELREFARTVLSLSHQLEAHDRPMEAWSWINSVLRASRHVGTRGCMIERLVGSAITAVITHRLETWASNPALTEDDLRSAIKDFDDMVKLSPSNSENFQIEYLMLAQTLDQLESGKLTGPDLGINEVPHPFLLYLLGEPDRDRRLIRIWHHNLLPFVDLPPHSRPRRVGKYEMFDDASSMTFGGELMDFKTFEQAADRSVFFSWGVTATTQVLNAMDRELTYLRLARLVLAAQLFYRAKGRFPNDVSELIPDYLPALDEDPFSGKPFLIKHTPDSIVVYSIFENRFDDGGTEFSFNQIAGSGRSEPNDLGFRLIEPGSVPLVAPQPFKSDENPFYEEE